MEKKQDRRVRKSKDSLKNSLIELMQSKSVNNITVKELVIKADLNRSTFYNYFDDIYDLMDYCWIAIMKDMDIEKCLNVQGEQNTEQIFSLLYEYLDQYRPQIYRILSKNGLEGRCMASLRAFIKKQIGQIISKCPGTRDFPVREDIMVDYYAATLEKCFFAKEQLSKEEALQTVGFLLGSVEKEAHKK